MKDFYDKFYAAMGQSAVHHEFCEQAYGIDLGQHGFADRDQLELLQHESQMGPADEVLDLGCGDGRIAEYLSDRTGAHVTGVDYIESAVRAARRRTAAKSDRLSFAVADINRLDLPAGAYDIILSIDTIYFSDDYAGTVRAMKAALRPGGRMAFLYSFGREPWVPKEEFRADRLPPNRTPLADALQENRLAFRTWDLTTADYRLALRRKQVLEDLKPRFDAEGLMFIHENRMGDALGVSRAIDEGLHARYLFVAQSVVPGRRGKRRRE